MLVTNPRWRTVCHCLGSLFFFSFIGFLVTRTGSTSGLILYEGMRGDEKEGWDGGKGKEDVQKRSCGARFQISA